MSELKEGAIVQIVNPAHHWHGALISVTELKTFGCMGFCAIPNNDGSPAGQAYIRLKHDDFEVVGQAVLMPAHDTSSPTPLAAERRTGA